MSLIDSLIEEANNDPMAAQRLSFLIAQATARSMAPELPPLPDVEVPVRPGTAARMLGYGKPSNLSPKVGHGPAALFRVGVEVEDRRSPGAEKASYWYYVERCRKRINEDKSRMVG